MLFPIKLSNSFEESSNGQINGLRVKKTNQSCLTKEDKAYLESFLLSKETIEQVQKKYSSVSVLQHTRFHSSNFTQMVPRLDTLKKSSNEVSRGQD